MDPCIVLAVPLGLSHPGPPRRDRLTRNLAVLGMILVGGLYALVAPLDGGLSRSTGGLAAALLDFATGTLVIAAMLLATRQGHRVTGVRAAPRTLLLGGMCGAVFVTAMVVTVGTLGAAGVAATTITGQLVASLAIDRFGLVGLRRRPVARPRVVGAALLLAGTALIVFG